MFRPVYLATILIAGLITVLFPTNKAITDYFDHVVVVYSLPSMMADDVLIETGAGFFVDSDMILTSYHIVDDTNNIEIRTHNGAKFKAALYGYDRVADVALLQIPAKIGDPVSFATSDPDVGSDVFAIGHPRGLTYSVSRGIVSHTARASGSSGIVSLAQIDAAINPGSSGGAVFDESGKVVGMIQSIVSDTSAFAGIGLVYKSADIVNSIKLISLSQDRIAERAIIDAKLGDYAYCSKFTVNGLNVENISQESVAYKSGLRKSHIITMINGHTVNNTREVAEYVKSMAPGDTIYVVVFECSSGNFHTIDLRLSSIK